MSVTSSDNAASTQPGSDSMAAAASTSSLRILMGVPAPGATGGGPALHLPMLAQDLGSLGFEVVTFPFGRWSEGESALLKIVRQAWDWLRFPLRVWRARPDLVHLNSALDRRALLRDVPFTVLARLLGQRVLIKWHGSETQLLRQRGPWGLACRLLMQNLAVLCVLSQQERRDVRAAGFDLPCHVVRNGLEIARYHQHRDVRARLGIDPESPLLLFIARLIPTKGLRDTLEAMQRLPTDSPAVLLVIGDGPERQAAEQRSAERDLQSRVCFLGRLTEAEALDYYCGCDILVFPTFHAEGFPMSIFQAVAGGMGIITTRIRAAADHLSEPENVLFVPAHDPGAVAAAMQRLLTQPQLLGDMQQANRRLAARFDRKQVASQFATIYRSAVPGTGERAETRTTTHPEDA
jgi:glycosyltransferase involved in cell wall biosynthesis